MNVCYTALDSCLRVYISTQNHTIGCRLYIMLYCLVILIVLITPRVESTMCGQGAGFYNGKCDLCPLNTYKTGWGPGECTACRGNSATALKGRSSRHDCECKNGFEPADNAALLACRQIPCDPGHWNGPAGCVACTTGKYKVGHGAQHCDNCESGSYSTVTGATSAVHCLECDIGTTPNAEASGCSCPVTYSAHALTNAFESGSTAFQDCIEFATQ